METGYTMNSTDAFNPYQRQSQLPQEVFTPEETRQRRENHDVKMTTECSSLRIRQQPKNARVAIGKEKDRKPIDPPPIIQLTVQNAADPHHLYLQSPYFFASCSLVPRDTPQNAKPGEATDLGSSLSGSLVSSLHRLKDSDNVDGAFFIFGDLSIKVEGEFRLQFNLFQMRDFNDNQICYHIRSIVSEVFTAHPPKAFPGMSESTFLTRSFSDQGVRLRIRKEPRALLKKRGPASEDYQPRHYKTAKKETEREVPIRTERSSLPRASITPQVPRQAEQHLSPAHQQSYSQLPSMDLRYSQQPPASMPSIANDPLQKRPRPGSEHLQHQHHHQQQQQISPQSFVPGESFESSSFTGTLLSQSQQSFTAYNQQSYPQPGYSYVPSQSTTSAVSRGPYFPPQQFDREDSSHSGSSTPYASSGQRQAAQAWLPQPPVTRPYQSQIPYNPADNLVSPNQRLPSAETLSGGFSHQGMASYGSSNMGPPPIGQMGSGLSLGGYTIPSPSSRQGVQSAPFRDELQQTGMSGGPTPPRSSSLVHAALPKTLGDGYPRSSSTGGGLPSNTEGEY